MILNIYLDIEFLVSLHYEAIHNICFFLKSLTSSVNAWTYDILGIFQIAEAGIVLVWVPIQYIIGYLYHAIDGWTSASYFNFEFMR